MNISNTTPLLDQIDNPSDLRKLARGDLRQFADELQAGIDRYRFGHGRASRRGPWRRRTDTSLCTTCSTRRKTNSSGTSAIRLIRTRFFTGRRSRMRTLRQGGGLSGFTKRAESEYDPFGAAHSSTSISAGLGMAVARDLKRRQHNVDRRDRRRRDERGHGL